MDIVDVVCLIHDGEFDDHLETLLQKITERRNTIGILKARSIQIGDIVVFNDKARPKYLKGQKAEVTGITIQEFADGHGEADLWIEIPEGGFRGDTGKRYDRNVSKDLLISAEVVDKVEV